jgi:hypothetical protein
MRAEVDRVIEAGDSGPITPVGINLPNEQDIRQQYGYGRDHDQLRTQGARPQRHTDSGSTAKIYPPPQTVLMYRGFLGSGSIFTTWAW